MLDLLARWLSFRGWAGDDEHANWLSPSGDLNISCKLEPATRPGLRRVPSQIALLDGVIDAYLVPDNHLGRVTVSSRLLAVGGPCVAPGAAFQPEWCT